MAGSERVRIKIKGYEHALVDAAAAKIVETAKRGGAQKVSGPIPLPTETEIVTILRAVHKYKDSREQFELLTHNRCHPSDAGNDRQSHKARSSGGREPRCGHDLIRSSRTE